MDAEHSQYYAALDLTPGASPDQIKEAYRTLVKVWHPDRFGSDPVLQAKAQEKLKLINHAFRVLSTRGAPRRRSARSAAAKIVEGYRHEGLYCDQLEVPQPDTALEPEPLFAEVAQKIPPVALGFRAVRYRWINQVWDARGHPVITHIDFERREISSRPIHRPLWDLAMPLTLFFFREELSMCPNKELEELKDRLRTYGWSGYALGTDESYFEAEYAFCQLVSFEWIKRIFFTKSGFFKDMSTAFAYRRHHKPEDHARFLAFRMGIHQAHPTVSVLEGMPASLFEDLSAQEMYFLGCFYETHMQGNKARWWFTKAAAQGHQAARAKL